MLENVTDSVITDGVCGSRAAWSRILRLVSLTKIVFSEGRPSGNADENAQSSSSAATAAVAVSGGAGVDAFGAAKSNIEGVACCGVDDRIGDDNAANGSTAEACWLGGGAACL